MLIAGYVPCSLSDYPRLIAAVVFTQGCNWRCPWCHNKGLIPLQVREGALAVGDVLDRIEERKGRLDGVVITGGEPTLQEGLADFIRSVKSFGFRVKLDTNGSNPEIVAALLAEHLLDFVAMDIKAPWEGYARASGLAVDVSKLQSTVQLLRGAGVAHQLRTTRWPGLSAQDFHDIQKIALGSPHVWQPYRAPQD